MPVQAVSVASVSMTPASVGQPLSNANMLGVDKAARYVNGKSKERVGQEKPSDDFTIEHKNSWSNYL